MMEGTDRTLTLFKPYVAVSSRSASSRSSTDRPEVQARNNDGIVRHRKPPPTQPLHNKAKLPTTSISSAQAIGTSGTDSGKSEKMAVEKRIQKVIQLQTISEGAENHWMPDELCHECSNCNIKFSLFIRKHHCRICGRIFCHACSNHSILGRQLKQNTQGNIRVCSDCLRMYQDVQSSRMTLEGAVPSTPPSKSRTNSMTSLNERQISPEGDSLFSASLHPSLVQNRMSWEERQIVDGDMSSPARASSTGIEFDNPAPHRRSTVHRTSLTSENILALNEDEVEVRLQEIWQKFQSKEVGLLPSTHRHRFRTFQNSFSGYEIVEWLMANDLAQSREMGVRIGQALVHTKCLAVVSNTIQDFKDIKDCILEKGEASEVPSFPTSPTVADAPNWFLSDEGEEKAFLEHGHNQRTSFHEANIDTENRTVAFHRHKSNELFKRRDSNKRMSLESQHNIESVQEETEETLHDGLARSRRSILNSNTLVLDTAPNSLAPGLEPNTTSIDPSSLIHSMAGLQNESFTSRNFDKNPVRVELKKTLMNMHQSHFDAFILQLVRSHGLSMSWIDIIKPLILEACYKVQTNITPDDFMDIKYYCKVKKIPGGHKSSCKFVDGVVFSKNVTHRKMKLSLHSPRILLLKCAFEFQRKENQLSSFDTLLSQEHEYLKHLVERVKKFQPDIILVQKSVSRFALERLHEVGIVVVVNIKPSVMARVARSTDGDLLSSLDQLYFNVKLGTCGQFYVRTFTLPDGIRKTLLYLDECDPKFGGVILLQGSTNNVLKRVKQVVMFGLQVAHNMLLESSFLFDEFAKPQYIPQYASITNGQNYYTPPSTPEPVLFRFSSSLLAETYQDFPAWPTSSECALEEGAVVEEPVAEGGQREGQAIDGNQTDRVVNKDSGRLSTLVEEDQADIADSEKAKDASTEEGNDVGAVDGESENEVELDEDEEVHLKLPKPLPSEELFETILAEQLMSTSPGIVFNVPYLQTEKGLNADIRHYLPEAIYWSHCFKPRGPRDVTCERVGREHSRTISQEVQKSPIRHSYKSVSDHPLTQSTFLLPASNNMVKSAFADFRSRASVSDEPNCFFFPSAYKGSNMYEQLARIFSKSKDFESMVEGLEEEKKVTNEVGTSTISQRTKRRVVPEKGVPTSLPPTPWSQPDISKFEATMSPIDKTKGFSKVMEHGGSPEPSKEETNKLIHSEEWSILMEEQLLPNMEVDCLDPFNHQFISLVFSSTCHDGTKHMYPCVMPCVIPMSYYGRNDIHLGEFLQRYCFRDNYVCQSCTVDMSKHQRHFVHGNREIRISMQPLTTPIPGGENKMFTWLTCLQCSQNTPLVPMSEESLLFSFAKFLELKFYGSIYLAQNMELDVERPICTHPLHSCYAQHFCFKDKMASFEPYLINIFEVRIPPLHVSVTGQSGQLHHDYAKEVNRLGKLIEGVFCRIMQYLVLYCVEPVQTKVLGSLERSKAMRHNLLSKLKRLEKLMMNSGIFVDSSTSICSSMESSKSSLMQLQDGIADLKRSVTDTVLCFNLELEEIDAKLRDLLSRKESSPLAPPSSSDHASTPTSTPGISPILRKKRTGEKATHIRNRSDPSPPIKQWMSQSMDWERSSMHTRKRLGHCRQFSDSLTIPSRCLEEVEEVEQDMTDYVYLKRTYSDSRLDLLPAIATTKPEVRSISFQEQSPTKYEISLDRQRSQTDPIGHNANVVVTFTDTEKGTPKEVATANTDALLLAVQSEEEDFFSKLRAIGKELEQVNKLYELRTSPCVLTIVEKSEILSKLPIKIVQPSRKVPSGSKDEPDGTKMSEKLFPDTSAILLSKAFQKLPPPFELTEHHMLRGNLRFPVSVYENEPTSIIAFALCSREYAHELKQLVDERKKSNGITESSISVQQQVAQTNDDPNAPVSSKSSSLKHIKNVFTEWRKNRNSSSNTPTSAEEQLFQSLNPNQVNADPFDESSGSGEKNDAEFNETIQWNSSTDTNNKFSSSHEHRHVSLEFADDTTKFFCKAYYAEEFRKLRELIYPDGEDAYIRCLGRCVKYEAKGGKSRAFFLKTVEDRMIMKQVQMVEITSFIEIAPKYFQHVLDAVKNERPIVLAKILGAYSIGFRNSKTGRSKRHHVIIMENLLYSHSCTRVFDLKGSMRGRYVASKDTKGDVLMDENFLEYIYYTPVYIWPHSKAVLMQAILADTQFLATNSIMDYSLLAALDEDNGELVVGVIDFVRPFTFDKRVEMYLKKAGRSTLPTIVYPELYRKRFIEAMDRYFTPVPDKWTGLGADIKINM